MGNFSAGQGTGPRGFLSLCLIVWLGALAQCALAETEINLEPNAHYLLDAPGHVSIDQVARDAALQWRRTDSDKTNFGYRDDAVWVRVGLPDNSTSYPVTWRLDLRKGFLTAVDIWLVDRDTGAVRKELSQSDSSRFSDRPVQYRHLVVDLEVPPGRSAELIVRYRTTGLTELPLRVETIGDFAARTQLFAAKSFLFQGVMIVLTLAGLVTFVVARAPTPLMYGTYLLVYALFVFHRDGYAFQFLWPDAPGFNAVASLPLGAALVVAGSVYTRMFLRTATLHPLFNRVLLANAGIAVVVVALGLLTDLGGLKQVMVVQASVSTLLFFAAGVNAARTRFKEVRFFVLGWTFAIGAAAVISLRHVLGIDLSSAMALDAMRVVAVLDAMMMGLALVDRYLQARAAHLRAVDESLAVARQNLDLHERLATLQRRHELAEQVAHARGQVLADATHDLRQPIHVLRMSIQQITQGDTLAEDARRSVEGSFQHLEELVEGHLAAAAVQPPNDDVMPLTPGASASVPVPVKAATETQAAEPIEAATILLNVYDMFASDAQEKGLRIRTVRSSVRVAADPLALMRVLSNLTANAVKYTSSGRILLGCRRRQEELCFQVLDTGCGMEVGEVEQMLQRSTRGSDTDKQPGYGIGLSIVTQIVAEHGWHFRCESTPGAGTKMCVCVPTSAP